MRRLLTTAFVIILTAALTMAATVTLSRRFPEPPQAAPVTAAGVDRAPSGTLPSVIARLQSHLRDQPRDAAGWATLGLAYVEQARVSADASYYPKAESVLARSLRIQPGDNESALTGRAALAAARHDFAGALRLADQALAVNAYAIRPLAVRVDALVELGRLDDAYDAVRQADRRRPGIPIFTRYAYVMELRGDAKEAGRVLSRAAASATDPGDIAYVSTQQGELAWSRGDLGAAERRFRAALRVDPAYLPALDGRAKVRAARGDVAGAIADRRTLVGRAPLPGYAAALGELYESRGQRDQAREQYAIVAAWGRLARANGVATDLETALIEVDHGGAPAALRAARAEWARRHTPFVADALAWALHVNGRHKEALTYAKKATGTGYANAQFEYHRGMIEKALGRRADARRSLAAALRLNPRFSPLQAPRARAALTDLSKDDS
jgi:tetratricopeptide (TPR) repeat protein